MDARAAAGLPTVYERHNVAMHDFDGKKPRVTLQKDGQSHEIECDFIAGCDGFHGVMPRQRAAQRHHRIRKGLPVWLAGPAVRRAAGVDELIVYINSPRGFSLFSMRSKTRSRYYLQCR
jgi:p-hydroxybenzoate 3-monooxygenase